jgi:hypothetical protein
LPTHRVALLRADAYESSAVYFVRIDTGTVTILEDGPNFSPNGQRFVVVKASESETVTNDVAIYAARSDPPKLEFAHTTPEGAYALYSLVGWEGEKRVKLTVFTRTKRGVAPQTFDAEAVLERSGWRLKGPPPGP